MAVGAGGGGSETEREEGDSRWMGLVCPDRDHPATRHKSRLLTPLKQELRERKEVEEEEG